MSLEALRFEEPPRDLGNWGSWTLCEDTKSDVTSPQGCESLRKTFLKTHVGQQRNILPPRVVSFHCRKCSKRGYKSACQECGIKESCTAGNGARYFPGPCQLLEPVGTPQRSRDTLNCYYLTPGRWLWEQDRSSLSPT